ncbi:MBL fold metallo-hydrolase [Formosa haliotis]|uniref:MBL fold metallo-hydrolase n=1 Tax=Formosa haliotis TaxID=1555194 RepID=UPI000824C106|nr:MBL fold metallo-hydrolase [Formosa haliotis]
MKKLHIYALLCLSMALFSFKPVANTKALESTIWHDIKDTDTKIIPISHATFILEVKHITIYVDPVGGAESFKDKKEPNLILITDIHGDHFNLETLEAVAKHHTAIITTQAVADKLSKTLRDQTFVLNNGESRTYDHLKIEAIPMYNLRPEALKYHTKGRGNGYVINNHGERIYISGDTEDIPEMRNLKDIDIALVCMNLPYTMPVDKAAEAILDFKPKEVIPYHYRGTDGYSDVNSFKALVNAKDPKIKVTLLDWYSKN